MRLRAICTALLAAALLSAAGAAPARADSGPDGLSCKAYMIYDYSSGQALAVRNPQLQQPIASLTKLMTAILACDNLRFDGRYVLTAEEQKAFKVETLRGDMMLELMLIASNNAVCKTVARIVAGGEPQFAELMNRRAAELGMRDTRFANASGLPAPGQHCTMSDLLLLTDAALKYPQVRQAMSRADGVKCGGTSYKATLCDLYKRHPGLVGGKTGYTKAAGRCLVLLYQSGGRDFIVITLGSSGVKASFRDAERILAHHGLYDGPVGEWR